MASVEAPAPPAAAAEALRNRRRLAEAVGAGSSAGPSVCCGGITSGAMLALRQRAGQLQMRAIDGLRVLGLRVTGGIGVAASQQQQGTAAPIRNAQGHRARIGDYGR
jgi:hypothetical protein